MFFVYFIGDRFCLCFLLLELLAHAQNLSPFGEQFLQSYILLVEEIQFNLYVNKDGF